MVDFLRVVRVFGAEATSVAKPQEKAAQHPASTHSEVRTARAGVHALLCGRAVSVPPPHLLLLPGLACDADVWKHQAHALAGVTTVSVADYGISDSLERMASVAIQQAPQRFALAGHSMGARVAFEIVRRAPERVAGLAILDSAYKPRAAGEAGEREKANRFALLNIAQTQGMRAMALAWLPGIVHPARLADQPLVASIVEMICRKTPEIFAAQIKALL